MNIVIDTNVVISGTFFGGHPRRIPEAIVDRSVSAYATVEMVEAYAVIVEEMIRRKQGRLSSMSLRQYRIIPVRRLRSQNFRQIGQKPQAILGVLPRIFGRYDGI